MIETDTLIEQLESKLRLSSGQSLPLDEKNAFKEIIDSLKGELEDLYRIDVFLGLGGTAAVFKVHNLRLKFDQALKIARPVAGRESLLSGIVAGEISRLRESSHPNIVQMFDYGSITWNGQDWPYYVMEFVEGGVMVRN